MPELNLVAAKKLVESAPCTLRSVIKSIFTFGFLSQPIPRSTNVKVYKYLTFTVGSDN